MKCRFYDKGIGPGGRAWRNIALVRDSGDILIRGCMIDLEPRRMTELFVSHVREIDFSVMWETFKIPLFQECGAFRQGETLNTEP